MKKPTSQMSTWNLSLIFSSDDDPQIIQSRKKSITAVNEFAKKWKKRRDYLSNPKILKTVIDEYEQLFRFLGTDDKENYYLQLRLAQNQLDPKIKGQLTQAQNTKNTLQTTINFFELNLAKIPLKMQNQFLKSPELTNYRHFLERIFKQAKHLLSEPEEKILTLKDQASYGNWVRMTETLLSKEQVEVQVESGKKQFKNLSELLSLMNNPQKAIRDDAARAFNMILQKHSDVAEMELNSILGNKQIDDNLRQFANPEDARLISDDYNSQIVSVLIQTVSSHFDIPAQYYKLKAKLLRQDKLAYHERNVEFGQIKATFSYPDAVKIVFKVLTNLDQEFGEIFQRFVEGHQFDVYPKQGKVSGAFCAYGLISFPTYILLNHNDLLNDCLTIAHETGHGINDELMKQQNALNFGTPLSVAEVSSTFMEDFVLEKVIKQADEEEKLSLLMAKLNADISTIFRQIACFLFEKQLHQLYRQKGYLSKEEIGSLFQQYMASYMGKYVEQSPGSENWWVYWSHIRNYFYNYSYANGLLISKALQHLVREDKHNILKVKEILSTGLSESPVNTFKRLGLNVAKPEFWEQGIAEVVDLLSETRQLAKKLGRI